MSARNLDIYLNDHLAGSVAALELLTHLKSNYAGTGRKHFLAGIHDEIEHDQQELKRICERLHVTKSGPRRAAAWLTEKVAQIKLWVDDSSNSSLRWLEAMEVLALGIEGKRALWDGLARIPSTSELQDVRFDDLKRRADDQRQRVEVVRLEFVREALLEEIQMDHDNAKLLGGKSNSCV